MSGNKITAQWVRENFPESSRIADDFRQAFGDDVRMTACEEGGRSIGKFIDLNDYQGNRTRELIFLGLDKDGRPLPKVMIKSLDGDGNGR